MSVDIREARVPSPLHDLSEKDVAASAQSIRPELIPAGQIDGEVDWGCSSRFGGHQDAGSEDAERDARAVGHQLRLGLVCQTRSVTPAWVTGKINTKKNKKPVWDIYNYCTFTKNIQSARVVIVD